MVPVDWTLLETMRRGKGLDPLPAADREQIEDLSARAIGLDSTARGALWGDAVGYGLYAAAVIRVRQAHIAVKVYQNAATRFVQFHRNVMRGCKLDGVQRTVDAVELADGQGHPRGIAILEYVPGDPLDNCEILSRQTALLLEQFFLRILIPLWARGHRFWDFRPANLVVSPDRSGLTLIDTDCLLGSFERIALDRDDWTKRDEAERLAFRRLPGCLAAFYPRDVKGIAQRTIKAELQRHRLSATLHDLGRRGSGTDDAKAAAKEFCGWAATSAPSSPPNPGRRTS